MIIVKDIFNTQNVSLLKQIQNLKYGLYKHNNVRRLVIKSTHGQTLVDSVDDTPIAYSNDPIELEKYANTIGLNDYEVSRNHCMLQN